MDRTPSADLGCSSDYSVEVHRRLKRSRFPCQQYLDMGQSVLTPEENLLGKTARVLRVWGSPQALAISRVKGEREFGPTFRNPFVGRRGCKAVDNGRSQGSQARGELSFLFDIADASNHISVGARRLNTKRKRRIFSVVRSLDYPHGRSS